MALRIDGKEYCKGFIDGVEYCIGYINGTQVFGCRAYNPPTVDDNSAVLSSMLYTFKELDFTKNFLDPDGDSYSDVTVKSLTGIGELRLLGATAKIGGSFEAVNSTDLQFHLSDDYAIYTGVLYQFSKSIDTIILEHEAVGYRLINNEAGTLTFGKNGGTTDTRTVKGTAISNRGLCFKFTTKDNSKKKNESNVATFCLIPNGDVNIKPTFNNEPPTVGDNEFTL